MPHSHSSLFHCAIAMALLTFAASVNGDVDLIQGIAPGDGAAPEGGVYVQDSAVAMDRIALAQRLENLKEWNKSADIYQEIVDKYRDRVVPCGVDEQGVINQYASVLTLVNRRLRDWPPEGLDVYRRRFELPAQNLLRAAPDGDLAALSEVFTRYFVTDSGKQAGLKLIDAYFELGDFSAAAWTGRALLEHPNLDPDRAKVLFRVGLAAHLSGDDQAAQEATAELKDKYAGAIGTIGGQDVNLSNELQADLARGAVAVSPQANGAADDSWPTVGGDVSRGKISYAAALPGAKLYSIDLPRPDWRNIGDVNQRKTLEAQDQAWRSQGLGLGIMPASDRGELFFQDNARVYALSLETGAALPGWLATYPNQSGQYVLEKARGLPAVQQMCVSLTENALLAVMDLPDPAGSIYGFGGDQETRLVCLDRQTGKENWILSPQDLPGDGLKNLHFGGAPLVVGDNVYLAARNVKGNGYDDCYVLCVDLAGGAYRWSCEVAGAVNTASPIADPNNLQLTSFQPSAHLSYAGGRVFVQTDLGAVAALDAYSGAVAWLSIYRDAADLVSPSGGVPIPAMPMRLGWGGGFGGFGGPGGFNNGFGPQPSWAPPSPWTANAPIVRGGNVFVLPADGRYILIYDAGNGRLIKRLFKSNCCRAPSDDQMDPSAGEPDTLLGVLDGAMIQDHGTTRPRDLLLVATSHQVCAIDWRQYDPDQPAASLIWASVLAPGDGIRGRPFFTADNVYVPAAQVLYRVAVRNGKIVQTYPADGAWPAGEAPGNVLVCGDHLVIAGDRSVGVYTDLSLARARLDQEIAAAPLDPGARLRYAEVMFLARRPAEAAGRLDEAIQLLAKAPASAVRNRAFSDALDFAVKAGQSGDPASGPLFDRAALLAQYPGQQAAYRLARARLDRFGPAQNIVEAIALYQQILADNALRTAAADPIPAAAPAQDQTQAADASVPPPAPADRSQAGLLARAELDAILSDPRGVAAYQPIEQAAQAQFAEAKAAQDPDRLLELSASFPNSSVAVAALDAAAGAYEARGQAAGATQALKQIYLLATDDREKAAILTTMARHYLSLPGGMSAAAGRLALAARLDPQARLDKPLTLPDGTSAANISLDAAAELLGNLAAQSSVKLPAFDFPSHAAARAYLNSAHQQLDPFSSNDAWSVAGVGTLLSPDQDWACPDRLATWTGGSGLSLYSAQSSTPLGTNADIADEPRSAAWISDGQSMLLWTGGALARVDGATAQTQWKLELASLPELDALAAPAPQTRVDLFREMDYRQVRRMMRGVLFPSRNRPFVPIQLPEGAADAAPDADDNSAAVGAAESVQSLQPVGTVAVLSTSLGRVAAVNLTDGRILWQNRVVDHAPDRVAANFDFTVVKTTDETAVRLVVFDTRTGRLLARRSFTADQGEQCPINIALGDDGALAYTLPDQIVIDDLYEAGREGTLERSTQNTAPLPDQPFAGMSRAGQLMIHDGQVLAICDDGRQLRDYAEQSGQLREFSQNGQIVPMVLETGDSGDLTVMRVGGGYVYAVGERSIAAYNLDRPEVGWGTHALDAPGTVRQMFLGRDYLVVMNAPQESDPPPPAPSPSVWWMSAFSRALVHQKPPTESGALVYTPQLNDGDGILAWQPVEGGMCYLGADHRLHVLHGRGDGAEARPDAP